MRFGIKLKECLEQFYVSEFRTTIELFTLVASLKIVFCILFISTKFYEFLNYSCMFWIQIQTVNKLSSRELSHRLLVANLAAEYSCHEAAGV